MYILKCGYENLSVNNNYTKGEKVKFQSNIGDKLVGYTDRYAWLVEFLVFHIWCGIKFGKFKWSENITQAQQKRVNEMAIEDFFFFKKEGQWNGLAFNYYIDGGEYFSFEKVERNW